MELAARHHGGVAAMETKPGGERRRCGEGHVKSGDVSLRVCPSHLGRLPPTRVAGEDELSRPLRPSPCRKQKETA